MGPHEELEIEYPAIPSSVPRARAAVAAAALRAGLAPARVDELRLVVSEAVTNVVLHAYDSAPGFLRVTVARAGDDLWVLVEDDGLGVRSGGSSPGLGLGLGLIESLSDELAVERGAGGGTLLRIRFGLDEARRQRVAAPAMRGRSTPDPRGRRKGSRASGRPPLSQARG